MHHHFSKELSSLSKLETLFVLKLAENKNTSELSAAVPSDLTSVDPDTGIQDVGPFSERAVSVTALSRSCFPSTSRILGEIYRARAEIFSELLAGILTSSQFSEREQENETVKRRLLDEHLIALNGIEFLNADSRGSPFPALGDRLGAAIVSDSKTRAASYERIPARLRSPPRPRSEEAAKMYREAVAAAEGGDKATAIRLFQVLAEQGYARAQSRLWGRA